MRYPRPGTFEIAVCEYLRYTYMHFILEMRYPRMKHEIRLNVNTVLRGKDYS